MTIRRNAGWLDHALLMLKPKQRQFLQRYFIHGDSMRRIASDTGVPQGQLRNSIRNAVQMLRRWAEQDGSAAGHSPGMLRTATMAMTAASRV